MALRVGIARITTVLFVLMLSGAVSAQTTWRRTYGGFGTETGQSVAEVEDVGFLITGTAGSFGNGASDMYAILLNHDGEPIWTRTYGTSGVEVGKSGRVLNDGFVFAGTTSLGEHGGYDMLLIKTDPNGEVLWQRNYGTGDWDLCNSMEILTDGFLLGGISYGAGEPIGSAYLIRTDFNGEVIWTSVVDSDHITECNALATDDTNGFAIAGRIGTDSGRDNGYIARFDPNGTMQWDLIVGGDSTDILTGIFFTDAGGVVANGVTESQSTVSWMSLVGTDGDGDLLWERFVGNEADAGGTGISMAHSGGIVVTGYNTLNLGQPDMIFTQLDDQGYFQSGNNFGNGRPALGNAISATSDGGYIVVGWSEDYGPGNRSCYVVKTDGAGQTGSLDVETYFDPVPVPHRDPLGLPSAKPCPAHAGTSVSLGKGQRFRTYVLLNTNGQQIGSGRISDGSFDLGSDLNGVFVIVALDENGVEYRFRLVVVGQ